TKISRVVLGLEGDFEAADRQFQWETYVNYGRNDADYFTVALNQQNFVNALNVVLDGQGQQLRSTTSRCAATSPGRYAPRRSRSCSFPKRRRSNAWKTIRATAASSMA